MSNKKIAVLSDIHSNFPAFSACFNDAIENDCEEFIFLGDYISDLSYTRETMHLLFDIMSKYPCHLLRGNRERYMLEAQIGNISFQKGSKSGSLLYTYNNLQKKDFELFKNLPLYDKISFGETTIEIAHSTKDNDRHYFDENSEFLDGVFDKMESSFFITGHAHRQYIKNRGGKIIVNPGSVGVPRVHGCIAQYALLKIDDRKTEWCLKEVPYDIRETIKHQFSSGLTDCSVCWGISILYDVITGRDYTMELLSKVLKYANGDEMLINDESVWKRFALELGLKFTEDEILQMI